MVKKKKNSNEKRNIIIGIIVLAILFTFAYYAGGYQDVNREDALNTEGINFNYYIGYLIDMALSLADICTADSDCGTGEFCNPEGSCLPCTSSFGCECLTDSDCPNTDQYCMGNKCEEFINPFQDLALQGVGACPDCIGD